MTAETHARAARKRVGFPAVLEIYPNEKKKKKERKKEGNKGENKDGRLMFEACQIVKVMMHFEQDTWGEKGRTHRFLEGLS